MMGHPRTNSAKARKASQLLAEIPSDAGGNDENIGRLAAELSKDAANLAAALDDHSNDAAHHTEEL